jgi:hypothetical protein
MLFDFWELWEDIGRSVTALSATYHITLFFVFFLVYILIGFEKHFGEPPGFSNVFYCTGQIHIANSPAGDLAPRTPIARFLMTVHAILSWGFNSVILIALAVASRGFVP